MWVLRHRSSSDVVRLVPCARGAPLFPNYLDSCCFGRVPMVPRRVFVVLGSLTVMLCSFFGHWRSSSFDRGASVRGFRRAVNHRPQIFRGGTPLAMLLRGM